MKTLLLTAIVPFALLTQFVSTTRAADTYEPDCFKPYASDTKTLHYPCEKTSLSSRFSERIRREHLAD